MDFGREFVHAFSTRYLRKKVAQNEPNLCFILKCERSWQTFLLSSNTVVVFFWYVLQYKILSYSNGGGVQEICYHFTRDCYQKNEKLKNSNSGKKYIQLINNSTNCRKWKWLNFWYRANFYMPSFRLQKDEIILIWYSNKPKI